MPYYVTFYSYKGGVGRTLTLLNVAFSLLQKGRSVFIWELDLEAPGILNVPAFHPLRTKARGGTVDLLAGPVDNLQERLGRLVLEFPETQGRLKVLPAGIANKDYTRCYNSVRWHELFAEGSTAGSELFERLRSEVDRYQTDFVLIDSRTGLTDVGAICTVQLPDAVVLVYNISHQNAEGIHNIQIALDRSARRFRKNDRELTTIRVACPTPDDQPDLMAARRADLEEMGIKPHVEIPFHSALLAEERIWTRERPDEAIAKPYHQLAEQLLAVVPDRSQRVVGFGTSILPGIPARGEGHVELRAANSGKTFEQKVADVLRLMDYEVRQDVLQDGRQVDFIAHQKGALGEIWYVGECKDYAQPVGVRDLDPLYARLAAFRKEQDAAQGLLVSRRGFTKEADAHAPKIGLTLRTYEDLLNGLVDLANYPATLIQDFEGQPIERLYVEPDCFPEEVGKLIPLVSYVDGFLADPEAVHLTLLGDYGTGKTWFTRKLAYLLSKRCREDPSRRPQPIRINLREVAKELSLEAILFDHIQKHTGRPVNPKAVLHLLSEGRFVLIFDGFDEMATQSIWEVTLENFRQIARAAEGKAKVILTCRTHYFKTNTQVKELIEGRGLASREGTELYREIFGRRGFRVAYLPGFNSAQVHEYLQKACGARAVEVEQVVSRVSSLSEIASRPVFLDMIVQVAAKLAGLGGDIKVVHLYEVFTEEWLQRQDWRLRMTGRDRNLLVEELAARLWETDGTLIHYRALAETVSGILNLSDPTQLELADREVRTASFLTRDAAGNYGFSHRSFLEFFLARRVARLLREAEGDAVKITSALRMRILSPPVIEFLRDLATPELVAQAAFGVLRNPYVPMASQNALLLAPLGVTDVAQHAIKLEEAQLAGFQLAGYRLPGANLRRARLAGADLRGANLKGACLAEADLELARLEGASCEGADFTLARLAGAQLRDADLGRANLQDADLSFAFAAGADLRGANLERAVLFGVAWKGAQGLPPGIEAEWASPAPIVQRSSGSTTRTLAYSLDGQLLASASGFAIRIYDSVTGDCRRVLAGGGATVLSVCWCEDRRRLAAGSGDGSVRVWDAETGKILQSMASHKGGVSAVAYHADGRQLAAGSWDGSVRVWDTETGALLRTLDGQEGPVWSVAYHADGRQLAAGSRDGSVRVWDAETGACLRTLDGDEDPVLSVAYLADGRQLAAGFDDGSVRVWDTETGALLRTLAGHEDEVSSVAYRADGRQLAAGSDDGSVRMWDTETGALLRTLAGHAGEVSSVAYRADGRQLAAGSEDGSVRVWDAETGALLRTLAGHEDPVRSAAYRADGRQLASGSDDGGVRVWDAETGILLRTLAGHERMISSVAYRADGRQLASGSYDGSVRLWDAETGALLRTLATPSGAVESVAYRADGRQLATGSYDGDVRLWDAETGALLRTLTGHEDAVLSVAYCPDGRQLASASEDGHVRVWDAETGTLLRTLTGHKVALFAVAYRPDGRQLAAASESGGVRLWDAETGARLRTLAAHGGWVRSVAYRPDGRQLATGCDNGSVRVWDPKTGVLLQALTGHEGEVLSVAYRADGRQLVSASEDGTARVWDAATGAPLRTLHTLPNGGWLSLTPDGRYRGNPAGLKLLTFAVGWALYPAEDFPELEEP